MNQHRILAIPAQREVEKLGDVVLAGERHVVLGIDDVVHGETQVALG